MNLVFIEWVDSHQGCGWVAVADVAKAQRLHCYSVGWVVSETKKAITLTANTSEKNHPEAHFQCTGMMTIPKCAIIKKEVISISASPNIK